MHFIPPTSDINYEQEILAENSTMIFRKPEEDAFVRHREFLEEVIDPDFGLLDKLLETCTLSWREIADIKTKDTFYKRNSELLDLISRKKKYDRLINALTNTNQSHVVKYINADGGERRSVITTRPKHQLFLDSFTSCSDKLLAIVLFSTSYNILL